MKQKLLALTACLLLLCSTFLSVSAETTIPDPTRNFFVADFAQVISSSDEQTMQQQGQALYRATGAQVVVVTIPTLDGASIEEYALQLARKWGIGDKDKDNGLLLLLSVAEPKVRIEVGSGLEGAIPDSKAGRILDTYMIPYYTPGQYSTGLTSTYDSLVNEVYLEYSITPEDDYTPIDEQYPEQEEKGSLLGTIFKILLGIGVLFLLIRHPELLWLFLRFGGRGGRGGGSGGGGGFSGGGGGFSGGGASR